MTSAPPRLARWLLLLIPAPDREFIEGDLAEEYAGRLRHGRTRADAWYWSQVLATVPPVFAQATLDILTSHPRRIPAMASPTAVSTSTTTPRPPAFGGLLLASNPPRSRGAAATNLVSAILHCGIVAGLVFGTMGQGLDSTVEEIQILEVTSESTQPPPPPPPPVAEAVGSLREPQIDLNIVMDHIPTEIPPPGEPVSAEQLYEWALRNSADTTVAGADEVVAIGDTPSFTPVTVRPQIRNLDEIGTALQREYPPLLRDAGVGGQVEVWIRLDDRGVFQDAQVNVSSGHPALDEAAVRVARIIEFSPAMNRDKAVPVWVSVPITFQVR